jgi:hypothetical protein
LFLHFSSKQRLDFFKSPLLAPSLLTRPYFCLALYQSAVSVRSVEQTFFGTISPFLHCSVRRPRVSRQSETSEERKTILPSLVAYLFLQQTLLIQERKSLTCFVAFSYQPFIDPLNLQPGETYNKGCNPTTS